MLLGFWRGPGAWEALTDAQRAGCLRVGWKAFHEVRAVFADPSPPEAWAEVACPVRLTIGEDSPAAVREVAFTLLEHLHQVEVREGRDPREPFRDGGRSRSELDRSLSGLGLQAVDAHDLVGP